MQIPGFVILILIVLILTIWIVVAAIMALDELVCLERAHYPDRWVLDGRPATLIRRSNDNPQGVQTTYAAAMSCWRWTCSTPDWMRNQPRAGQLIRRIRVLLILWTFVAVPALVAGFIVAGP